MQISVLGQTDKRPVIYTMLKMCEKLGDCCYITNDRKAARLMEDGPADSGTYRNISIYITDAYADDIWEEIGMAPQDFEFIFLDNLYNEQTNLVVYVKGAGAEEADTMILDAFEQDEYITVKMGKPDKPPKAEKGASKDKRGTSGKKSTHKSYNISYTADMPANIEHCEYYRELVPVTKQAATVCAEILSKYTKMSVKDMVAVSQRGVKKESGKK